jgi:hypothetical protein
LELLRHKEDDVSEIVHLYLKAQGREVKGDRLSCGPPVATIIGNIAGKALHVTMRLSQVGPAPPAGAYDIHPPVNDPIYGLIALMTPSTSSPGAAVTHTTKMEGGGMTATEKVFRPQASFFIKQGGMTSTGQVFVLSSRPILGQNSLVISHGFADLMDALTAAGGASVALS